MARNAANPLAEALDKRIRAMVEEALQTVVRDEVRSALREELASIVGSISGGMPAPAAPKRRGAGRPAKATATRTTKAAKPSRAARSREAAAGEEKCGVAGCNRPYRSRGYCAAHYQAARKYGWPMPAPKDFVPPPRPSRGRPPKAATA